MPRPRSAGLLLYRIRAGYGIEVFLVHPGGPFWEKRDVAAWSVPKGEHDEAEAPHAAALREFEEELGAPPPDGDEFALGELRQPGGKLVTVWARAADFDVSTVAGDHFEIEWPRGSGVTRSFPEVDRAAWFSLSEARTKLHKGQVEFLDRLAHLLDPDSKP